MGSYIRLVVTLTAIAAAASFGLSALLAEEESAPSSEGPYEHIRVVDFEGPIGPVPAAYVERQMEAARETGADCLVLRIDSPGGTVHHSMKIADELLELEDEIHVVAWIPKSAYSGAAMVAMACDEIVMGRSAHFGDAQPGTISAEGGWKRWVRVKTSSEQSLRMSPTSFATRTTGEGYWR